jgi:hypothetical protein
LGFFLPYFFSTYGLWRKIGYFCFFPCVVAFHGL